MRFAQKDTIMLMAAFKDFLKRTDKNIYGYTGIIS
jgi:hypothetical protein